MAIAISLEDYLSSHQIVYGVVKHHRTESAYDSAHSAHLPTTHVSKAVVLQDENGQYVMAAIPANKKLHLDKVSELLGRRFTLVSEHQLSTLFQDCARGAVPSLGEPYRMEMILDDELLTLPQLYIEGGDHEHLVMIEQEQFQELIQNAPHGVISSPRIHKGQDLDWKDRVDWEI